MRLRHADPRARRIAGCSQAVDIGLRDEAAFDQLQRAIEIGLREIGVGLRDLDLSGGAAHLLRLDRLVDLREHLTLAHPVTRVDGDRDDTAAFADHTNRHFTACSERTGGRQLALDRRAPGGDHGHRRRLGILVPRRSRGAIAASQEEGDNRETEHKETGHDVDAAATAPFGVLELDVLFVETDRNRLPLFGHHT